MKDTAPSRTEARVMGYAFYEGAPCKRGHQGIRYVGNKACRDCTAEASKGRPRSGERKPEHWRSWEAANLERIKAARQARAAREKLARAPRVAARKASQAEARGLKQVAKLIRREERRLDAEQAPARKAERNRAKARDRRAAKRGAVVSPLSSGHLAALLWLQRGGCAYCGATGNLHLDHKQPISRGGQHVLANVQYLCAAHNLHKYTTADLDYRAWQTIPFLTPWDADYGRTFLQASALA